MPTLRYTLTSPLPIALPLRERDLRVPVFIGCHSYVWLPVRVRLRGSVYCFSVRSRPVYMGNRDMVKKAISTMATVTIGLTSLVQSYSLLCSCLGSRLGGGAGLRSFLLGVVFGLCLEGVSGLWAGFLGGGTGNATGLPAGSGATVFTSGAMGLTSSGVIGLATLCISFWETGLALGPISTGDFPPCPARSFLERASASSSVRPT